MRVRSATRRSAAGRTSPRAVLASAGVKRRFDTAPVNGRGESARLAAWLVLVLLLIALGYGSRLESGKPDPELLYRWSTAVGGLILDAIVLGIVLAIASGTGLLALRRPVSWKRAAGMIAIAILAIYAFESVYTAIVHPGNEQGLTPKHWEPRHAAAYIGNAVVICGWVPFVEEITFRGLGY